jgi:hypothetical protein
VLVVSLVELLKAGFDDIPTLRLASDADLREVGLKPGHSLRLLAWCAGDWQVRYISKLAWLTFLRHQTTKTTGVPKDSLRLTMTHILNLMMTDSLTMTNGLSLKVTDSLKMADSLSLTMTDGVSLTMTDRLSLLVTNVLRANQERPERSSGQSTSWGTIMSQALMDLSSDAENNHRDKQQV